LSSPDARVEPMVGAVALLDALVAQAHCVVGLLTGNIEPGARRKLEAAGFAFDRFRVGAFGSDHELRDELPAIARHRARGRLGAEFRGEDLVIIGDTPSDITCGRPTGARAIAVATGHYTVSQLAAHRPAAVFADLSDTDALLRVIAHA